MNLEARRRGRRAVVSNQKRPSEEAIKRQLTTLTLTHAVGVDAREHRRVVRAHRIADARIPIERLDACLMKEAIRGYQRQSEDARIPIERLDACLMKEAIRTAQRQAER